MIYEPNQTMDGISFGSEVRRCPANLCCRQIIHVCTSWEQEGMPSHTEQRISCITWCSMSLFVCFLHFLRASPQDTAHFKDGLTSVPLNRLCESFIANTNDILQLFIRRGNQRERWSERKIERVCIQRLLCFSGCGQGNRW